MGVGGAGGVFGIGKGLFGSGGVGGTSISARIKSRPLCCARLSRSLIEHLQIHRLVVTLTCASWNQLDAWLRALGSLRRVA